MSEITKPKLTRAEAARINGAKSRGPKTPEGKAISARNAITHGLSATRFREFLLTNENPEGFDALYQSFNEIYRPGSLVEEDLVRELAWCRWCFHRYNAIEKGVLDAAMQRQREPLAKACPGMDEVTRVAAAFAEASDKTDCLGNALRHANSARRAYKAALFALANARQHRLENEKRNLQNEPIAIREFCFFMDLPGRSDAGNPAGEPSEPSVCIPPQAKMDTRSGQGSGGVVPDPQDPTGVGAQ